MQDLLPPRGLILERILRDAGERVLPLCGNIATLHVKADDSLLTAADLESETIVLAALQHHWPDDAIRSEECGAVGAGNAYWVVDPIDGTSAFSEGLAHWGPTVARVVDGRVECGAMFLPRLGEYYYTESKKGWLNGRLLGPIRPEHSAKVVYLPSRFHRYLSLDYPGKGRCLGGTAAHLAGVARGAASAALVAPGWSLWDTAAGIGLIEAVGGVVVRYPEGSTLDPVAEEGATFLAGLPNLVEDFLRNQRVTIRSTGVSHAGS